MVLTQQSFAWPKAAKFQPGFHTTMVLTQLKSFNLIEGGVSCFHTTMVLTQHIEGRWKSRDRKQFPYHYGSHATTEKLLYYLSKPCFHTTMVLTQRWTETFWITPSSRFHTTMVLTQLKSITEKEFLDIGFHTTMVLTQPWSDRQARACTFVSIPLWFSRNELKNVLIGQGAKGFHTTMVLTQPWR